MNKMVRSYLWVMGRPSLLFAEIFHRANRLHIKCLSGRGRMVNLAP
jgi:hypothetical protein